MTNAELSNLAATSPTNSEAVRSGDWLGDQPRAADTCPKCGGLDWYQVGNLRCCFRCAEGFIVGSGKSPSAIGEARADTATPNQNQTP